jgi:hypothetical protein
MRVSAAVICDGAGDVADVVRRQLMSSDWNRNCGFLPFIVD